MADSHLLTSKRIVNPAIGHSNLGVYRSDGRTNHPVLTLSQLTCDSKELCCKILRRFVNRDGRSVDRLFQLQLMQISPIKNHS